MNKLELCRFRSTSHPERSEGSFTKFFAFAQNDVIYQQGRSMVEMLGVLAVMGVLSVGGVAMYTNAMNKYKANELLNEASKRAVVVATRALSGQTSIPLTEFSGHSSVAGGTFADEESVDVSGNTFAIKIKGVDSAVCTQMKNSIGSNTVVREIPETCGAEVISLVFNKDLSSGNTSSGNETTDNPENTEEPETTFSCEGYDPECCNENGIIDDSTVGCGSDRFAPGWATCQNGQCVCVSPAANGECCDGAYQSKACCEGPFGDYKWTNNGCCESAHFIPDNSSDRTYYSCCTAFGYHWIPSNFYSSGVCCEDAGGTWTGATCCYGGMNLATQATDPYCMMHMKGQTENLSEFCSNGELEETCGSSNGGTLIWYDRKDTPIFKEGYYQDEELEEEMCECCVSEHQSPECCHEIGSGSIWTGGSCCTGNNCCASPNQSYDCCINIGNGGVWNGTECCESKNQSEGCCSAITANNGIWTGSECCESPGQSESCCSFMTDGHATWYGDFCG